MRRLGAVIVLVIGRLRIDYIQESIGNFESNADARVSDVGEGHVSL